MIKKIVLGVILAFVGYRLFSFILVLGFHRLVYSHHPGPCRLLKNIDQGSEDLEPIPGDKALITSGLRFLERDHLKDRVGKIFMFDFNYPEKDAQPVALKNFPKAPDMFDPHGISSWVDSDTGEVTVFIVSHYDNQSHVEVFTYSDREVALYYQETAIHSCFAVLNDVVATGRRQFYVTNYLHMRNKAEMFLQLRWSSVARYDNGDCRLVSTGYGITNGINTSPDGRYLYLSHIGEREIIVFAIKSDGALEIKQRVPVYAAVDNINVDKKTGDLWTANHYVGYQTLQYLRDPTKNLSPSQVLRLEVKDGLIHRVTEVLLDDGTVFSGSSASLYVRNQLLVGSIHTKALLCDVTYLL